jgi:hypothetical protein
MDKHSLVAYCGLYCDLCSQRTKVPEQAKALMKIMKKDDYENFGPDIQGFNEFWKFLKGLTKVEEDKYFDILPRVNSWDSAINDNCH